MTQIIINSTGYEEKNNPRNIINLIYSRQIYLTIFLFFIFISSVVFFIWALIGQPNNLQKTQAYQKKEVILQPRFKNIEDIPFVVEEIEKIKTNGKKYFNYLKENNPKLGDETIKKELNYQIFLYYALNNFNRVKIIYPENYKSLLEKNNQLLNQYNEKVIKYTGYFIKIRFSGYYGDRYQEIKNIFGEENLRNLARQKITELINNNPDPSLIYPSINDDQILSELNNKEQVIGYFEEEDFNIDLFDDYDFYEYISKSPLNQYSQIYTLKTKNPFEKDLEEYAFLTFYLLDKQGELIPVNKLIKKILNEKNYR